MLEIGIKGTDDVIVNRENVASCWGSGDLDVFATPAMIACMESTSAKAVEAFLCDGQSTVGTLVNVKHLRATPMGKSVHIESTLTQIDRRRLVFEVRAFDDKGIIGEGTHERFIIDIERFISKLSQ